jgi:hypothetical protein
MPARDEPTGLLDDECARRVHAAFIEAAANGVNLRIYTDAEKTTRERINETLTGMSVMLRRTIDAKTRAQSPMLEIRREGAAVVGRWKNTDEVVSIEMTSFIYRQAKRFGEFSNSAAEILATVTTRLLVNEKLPLIGFHTRGPGLHQLQS